MNETQARHVLLLQAHESGAETPLWTTDDRAWATRLALQTSGATTSFEGFVTERARHALERLLPRDATARRWLERRSWRPAFVAGAALGAWLLGVVVDHIGAPQRIDLLAPPVWALVVWNLAVYLGLALPGPGEGLRGRLARRWSAGSGAVAALWLRQSAPLALARAALVLHVAAAALALGLVAGLYLRGLVLDYRAGWQSTFLVPPAVQAILNTLLAPAEAVTGITVPDVAPLRLTPGVAASGSAAPWIHLYAMTLLLWVVLPRLVLAGFAAWRERRLRHHFPLLLEGVYFDRLRAQQTGAGALVQVLPHGSAPGAQAALGLRAVLAGVLGETLDLRFADVTAYGDEDQAAALTPVPGTTLRLVLVDLAATPEAEAQGRFVAALKGALPVLVFADETGFVARFGSVPERLAERRAAWQRLADAHGAGFASAGLDAPDLAAAQRALKAALA